MDFIQKNKKNIVALTVILLLLTAGLFAWLQKKVIHSDNDIAATVYPLKLSVGDTLYFADNTPFATHKRWSFGDGSMAVSDSGTYRYSKPGYYQVSLLINGQYSRIMNVQVLEKPEETDLSDSLVSVNAPHVGMQFENIVFRSKALNATAYRWKFGESGNIDSKDPLAIYAYQQPGDYTVLLYTNTTEYPVLHKITILPAFKTVNDSISLDNTYEKIDNDFKTHLQLIANGSSFNANYNYLLATYLCQNEKAIIKVNGSKVNDFNSYCLGLQFDKGITIFNVKCGFDDNQKCVKKVEIQQGK
ncbi:hypothetical protein SAMN05421788_105178 [Filimonas lacunae]|uniref:PKD domain-containing protein n=1 Tax=Filimonas lacunae TaxID=477680 RepID=A0A173MCX6_9BACT|nr:PKD domain-containing protein [Filimonas lacunae]BAV05367.1 hypothetical protein FLA_1374 [Filimonas lacunae]SIT21690.1 hypothetical protein SAMN05421788_105178 [Filimonas lacunae]